MSSKPTKVGSDVAMVLRSQADLLSKYESTDKASLARIAKDTVGVRAERKRVMEGASVLYRLIAWMVRQRTANTSTLARDDWVVFSCAELI